ncbi:MAG: DUF4350 domain-containing protein [Pyrinomonadaceae bacterium]|nr:DUF4350 domain-containing protein [Pyrinomonadaceae bacterium]MCX7639311.1 DUF4350 domain-containing protein [Pyrinomonadaceae bacterium]MDW8303467.1 DUF4350 domain-containing protein [Acidobacteriota bacterium]
MKQKIILFFVLFLCLIAFVSLNAISYIRRNSAIEKESFPNRSSFNSGATGTKAFYEILSQTGKDVIRWQKPIEAFIHSDFNAIIIVEPLLINLTTEEIEKLLEWVSTGNKLILITRSPEPTLLNVSSDWTLIASSNPSYKIYEIDPYNASEMTHNTAAINPSYPTLYSRDVIAIQPSQFATKISLSKTPSNNQDGKRIYLNATTPVVHFADKSGAVLISIYLGSGEIVLLSDPFIVSNTGIKLADNLQMALNLVESQNKIAFDEYHHGYGSAESALINYFRGTPIFAFLLQLALISLAILFSRSQRFTRPLPMPRKDRLSKLEYVSAMAELQKRARAYDLALENVYLEFRRRVSSLFGLDSSKTYPEEMATQIRSRIDSDEKLEKMLRRCEAVCKGIKIGEKEAMDLVSYLRKIEEKLGIRKRERRLRL